MEGLKRRAFGMGIGLVAVGVLLAFTPRVRTEPKTEEWLNSKAPKTVDDYSIDRAYKMDQKTYETLAPYGIVSQIYANKDKKFDVVLIASRSKDSFHNPFWCFTAQNWTITKQEVVPIQTKARGQIEITVAEMAGPQEKSLTAFFYRGPNGFYATTNGIKWGMFKAELLAEWTRSKDLDGVFYRFIPQYPNATREELIAFVDQFLSAAKETSGGYY